jgi:HKD family nuclease
MRIKFIGQGLDPDSDHTAGNMLIDSLNDPAFTSFNAFVAFVSTGGLKNILDQLTTFIEREGRIRLYIGVDLNATSKEALEKLLEMGIETYVIYSPNNIIYHPKIYTFEGDAELRAIVGSTNLTESGLFQNIEAAVCVDFPREDRMGAEFLADIYDHFNSIINVEHPSCRLLTPEVLEVLIESKVVLSEAAVRAKVNQVKKEFEKNEASVLTRLAEMFAKVKPKRPPKGYKRSVTKKELASEATDQLNVVEQAVDLTAGAMWIETGMMTGGSRNILDLSKHGRLEGVDKFGSVSFFGLDPEATGVARDITIVFGGKTYPRNTIFYAPANNNWRLRMNGETEGGERITTFSIATLGHNGGFQNVILLFTRTEEDVYHLELLDKEEMPKLIENSDDWARGGHGGGRAYGIVR